MQMKRMFQAILSIVLVGVILFTDVAALSTESVIMESQTSVNTQQTASSTVSFKITSSKSKKITTKESAYTFTGKADPQKTLTLNGKKVAVKENGSFTKKVNLKAGKNTFTFAQGKHKQTYTVEYQYVLIKRFTPDESKTYSGGKVISVSVTARKGSTATATFRGKKIKLTARSGQTGTFVKYAGKFTLPKSKSIDINYGKIKFCVKNKVKSETVQSGNIICKKAKSTTAKYKKNDPAYNLSGGRYLDVGKGKIAEVVCYEAETFNANSTNDWSRPTNNYLPKGTVDYCSNKYAYYREDDEVKKYAVMRCGLQTYTTKKDSIDEKKKIKVTKVYNGTLPTYNKIEVASFKNGTTHTTLTVDTMWKAPFYFKIPQSYVNPSNQDYRITKATYKYIDITFCYATVFKGKINIPKDNPIFKSAKIIKNESDYTLRLYLKEKGSFYGWMADFNAKGQLVFRFLNPAKIVKAKNAYGYDLTGVKILVDVGHGGKDPGAVSCIGNATEASRNLVLAKLIKKELEGIGATVYMTRTSNVDCSTDGKLKSLRKIKPDYCVAVHHDSNDWSSLNGFCSYYSQPFSMQAAKYIRSQMTKTKIYKKNQIDWHFYYMARATACPVVLTENGYLSNYYDCNKILNTKENQQKAKAIVKGIVQYFKAIQ